MGTVCLSPAPALRCVGLSLREEIITLVPTALEVIFSLGLIFVECDAGRIRYILAAEGPTYLFLLVLGLLNRVVPLFEYSLEAHKILDIAIGAASFIPMLLYMFYLYLFKRKEFFPNLPQRFTLVANTFALAVIPVIIVTNEIVSFLGIRYRKVPNPENLVVGNQVPVEPDLFSFQFGRDFLRSISLALLVIYQTITFLLFFMRLASCFLEQREIEVRAAAEREGIIFRGIGWLVIGMKISAIETAVGFATTSFGIVLTRRILRMLGRACIVIGVVKGVDRKEEFFILDSDKDNEFLSGTRKLRLSAKRQTISSPRLLHSSMTQRMSRMTSLRPSLATFASPRAGSPRLSDAERTPFVTRGSSDLPPDWPTRMSVATTRPRPEPLKIERFSSESHVSVIRGYNTAPTLVLNLSPMDLPSGDIFAVMNRRNENRARTSTIDENHFEVAPMPHSAPLQRRVLLPPLITSPPPGIPSGYPENDSSRPSGLQGRERSRTRASRRRSLPPAIPPVPFNIARASAPLPPLSYAWPTVEPDRSETHESPQTSTVSPRSRGDESQSTLGCYLIDWIAPEAQGESRVTRFKSVGAAPRRTTPTPTSGGPVRNSVVLERHETLAGTRVQGRSRREMARKDSGVLGMDDPALARASLRPQ